MGLLDRLVGGGRGREANKTPEPAPEPEPVAAAPQSPPELTQDTGSSSFGPARIDASAASASTTLSSLAMNPDVGAAGGRLYDPYEGLSTVVGKKHAFKLPDQPEFVFEEEAAVKQRGWTENLQFYTGIGYLAGGVAGVGAGLYTYATVKSEIPLDSWKLKANRILNSSGAKAKPFANGFGILGLFFASYESYLNYAIDMPELPESLNTIAAGALSGATFRAPRGPRQALAAGLVGAVGGAGIAALRTVFPSL